MPGAVLFICLLAASLDMQDLSSLARNQTSALSIGRVGSTTGPSGQSPRVVSDQYDAFGSIGKSTSFSIWQKVVLMQIQMGHHYDLNGAPSSVQHTP